MSKLKLTTLANIDDSLSVPMDTVAQGTAKAWVNFNGTGTVAIRRAFNVSSITDNGTGDYTVNFTNAMSDADYIACANASYVSSGAAAAMIRQATVVSPFSTTSVRMNTGYSYPPGYSMEDTVVGQLSIFR